MEQVGDQGACFQRLLNMRIKWVFQFFVGVQEWGPTRERQRVGQEQGQEQRARACTYGISLTELVTFYTNLRNLIEKALLSMTLY